MFLIKTGAFRDTQRVLREQRRLINSLTRSLRLLRGVIKDFQDGVPSTSLFPTLLSDADEGLFVMSILCKGPQGVLSGCPLQGALC